MTFVSAAVLRFIIRYCNYPLGVLIITSFKIDHRSRFPKRILRLVDFLMCINLVHYSQKIALGLNSLCTPGDEHWLIPQLNYFN